MKRGKILVVSLIGLLMAGGLFLAGCEKGCPGSGDCQVSTGSNGTAYISDYCGNGDCAARKILEYKDGKPQANASASCNCN